MKPKDHNEAVESAFTKLKNYIEAADFSGYDPYDGLMSPLFRLPVLRSYKPIRFYAQQLIKRSPVNLRPLLGIQKSVNPVTLGLCIQGYTATAASKAEAFHVCDPLVERLKQLQSKGFSGACWGYNFDWEARYATIPAYQPTVVATGIIINALYKYATLSGDTKADDLISGAAQFVLNDLRRTTDPSGAVCFSYSPFDSQRVYNASLKGGRILAQAGARTGNKLMLETAIKAAEYVAERQQPNGAWTYAESKGTWTDNYHTGYVLDCLSDIARLCAVTTFDEVIKKGFDFYRNHFFETSGMPKFYHNAAFPVDCTAAAQSILTLTRFGATEKALEVAAYMIGHMQSKSGAFYFRKYRSHTEKISFMRWSDSWMFAAFGELLREIKTERATV
ncbi:MAG TPA: delta-aminolevulinic acid dehydratase [Bacteroidia bacterium]|nr:delta-aminolevulinic acid dehydratase [Bacteroidia bacterium]